MNLNDIAFHVGAAGVGFWILFEIYEAFKAAYDCWIVASLRRDIQQGQCGKC